jgi:hypothetical protein
MAKATLVIILTFAACILAQDPEFRVRVDVNLVTLQAEVFDTNERPITDLSRDDFLIYEDGRLQQIQQFSSIDTPYSILALFDCTTSMREYWQFLTIAMNRFVATLRPQDRVSIAAFGSRIDTLLNWTPRDRWAGSFPIRTDMQICTNTDFYGALTSAAKQLQGIGGRTGVIVFSDGINARMKRKTSNVGGIELSRFVDSTEDSEFQSALKTIRAGKTLFYFVAVNTDLNPTDVDGVYQQASFYSPLTLYNRQQVRSRIEQFANAAGGRGVFPVDHADYAPLFEQIAKELGSSYTLAYAPPPGSSTDINHRIEVRTTRAGLRVRQSRDSYGGGQ